MIRLGLKAILAVTIAVTLAVAAALWSPLAASSPTDTPTAWALPRIATDTFGAPASASIRQGPGLIQLTVTASLVPAPRSNLLITPVPVTHEEIRVVAGFPFPAFGGSRSSDRSYFTNRLGAPRPARTRDLVPVPTGFPTAGTEPRSVPTGVLWSGLAANAAIAFAVLHAADVVAGALRRRSRRARGFCGACGHPGARSTNCSECGANLAAGARPLTG